LFKLTAGRVKLKLLKMKKSLFTAFAVGLCMTANLMAQVPSYVPTNGLVGWWPFNGNANDESGNGNNGSVNGATLTTDRFGNANKAYSFDGVNDLIEVPNSTSLNSASSVISISTWFNINNWFNVNNTGWFPIMSKSNSSSYGNYRTGFTKDAQGNYGYYSTLNSDEAGAAVIIGLNIWNQVTSVINDVTNQASFYINGTLVYQGATHYSGWSTTNTLPLIFGMDKPGIIDYTNGKLDDIGIWNRALTQQEITDLYNGNVCYDYVTVTDTLVINTGITGYNPITYMNTLKIWPNPSNDHITIDAGNLATMNGYSIKIEDAQGQQVFQNAVNQQQFYVDITTWGGNGLYFVRIIDPQGNTVDIKKIVLQ
jgi:hypothetical protein